MQKPPVILLAFANDHENAGRFLRNLDKEKENVIEQLKPAEKAGLCEVVLLENASINNIVDAFQSPEFRGRISVFHFAGHAGGYFLALESASGEVDLAHANGFAEFLGNQKGLSLVFLNGCSTEKQTDALLQAKVDAVISTSQSIDDNAAMNFSSSFYQSLASGDDIQICFKEAAAIVKIHKGDNMRDLYWEEIETPPDRFPWNLFIRKGAEIVNEWNLPEASANPLFGLPELPLLPLPEQPYRYLQWYQEKDAEIFFGRAFQIRALYDKLKDKHREGEEGSDPQFQSPSVIHFYGKSGVGKSSLLAAGLLPRLKQEHEVLYVRRDQKLGLWNSLANALEVPNGTVEKVKQAWLKVENQKPLIFILDQVEEAFTRPNPELLNELETFIELLAGLFEDHQLKGKIILSYRKEYLAEIENAFKTAKIDSEKVFLENLKKPDIMEAILGLTKTDRLRQHYKLEVEKGLPEIIADDLLEDPDGSVAPILQILLSNFWEKVKTHTPPRFTKELYFSLKKEGLWMDDFLKKRLNEVAKNYPEADQSGLTVGLLVEHTTPKGTATQAKLEDLLYEYPHSQEKVRKLVQELLNQYLLLDMDGKGEKTRLAHDTLAIPARRSYASLNAPGPQSMRILNSRLALNKDAEWEQALSPPDLEWIEKGRYGMPRLSEEALRLVLASYASSGISRNATIKLRMAEAAHRIAEGSLSRQALVNAFHSGPLFSNANELSGETVLKKVFVSLNGTQILTVRQGGNVLLTDQYGKQLCELEEKQILHLAMVSSSGKSILTASPAGELRLWDLDGKKIWETTEQDNKPLERIQGKFRSLGIGQSLIKAIAFVKETEKIRWISADSGIREYDPQKTGSIDLVFKSGQVTDGGLSADGSKAALLIEGEEIQWMELDNPEDSLLIRTGLEGERLYLSPDGFTAVLTNEGTVSVFHFNPGSPPTPFKIFFESYIERIAFHPDTSMIAIALEEKVTMVVDRKAEFLFSLEGYKDNVDSLAFCTGRDSILMTEGDRLKEWKLSPGPWKEVFKTKESVQDFALSPKEDIFLIVQKSLLKREKNQPETKLLFEHPQNFHSIAVSPDGKLLVAGDLDGGLIFWNHQSNPKPHIIEGDTSAGLLDIDEKSRAGLLSGLQKPGQRIKELVDKLTTQKDRIISIAISPDGKKVATASADASVFLWNSSGKLLKKFPGFKEGDKLEDALKAEEEGVFSDAVQTAAPSIINEKLIQAGLRGTDAAEYKMHTDQVNDVDFSPDGKLLLSASSDHRIALREVGGDLLYIKIAGKDPVTAVAFHPKENTIAWADEGGYLALWTLEGEEIWKIRAHSGSIESLAISPDGKRILTASTDKTALLWDMKGNRKLILKNADSGFLKACFAKDSGKLFSLSFRNVIQPWDINENRILELVKASNIHSLTEDEKKEFGLFES